MTIRIVKLFGLLAIFFPPAIFPGPIRIIDAFIHSYDPFRPQGVPWPGKSDTLLYRTALPADHDLVAKPVGVTGTVVVECSAWLEDNQWVLDRIQSRPDYYGFVGNLPIGVPEFAANLTRFAKNPKFLGIRLSTQKVQRKNLTPEILRDLRNLASHGLALEFLMGTGPGNTLDDVAAVASQVPELAIMIDHLAGIKTDGTPPPATVVNSLKAAAAYPRVYCKISSLLNHSVQQPGSLQVAYYRPLLTVLEQAFGDDRLVYGSNWPVSDAGGTFAQQQAVVMAYFQARGDSALNDVMWRNAVRFYHLPVPLRIATPAWGKGAMENKVTGDVRLANGGLAQPDEAKPERPVFRRILHPTNR